MKKQLAHILYEVMTIANRDPIEYGHYFSETEIDRIRDVCKGRWYKMTCDAVSEVYYKVILSSVILRSIILCKCLSSRAVIFTYSFTNSFSQREITLAEREAVKALKEASVRPPTPIAIEEAKHNGAQKIRKDKIENMKKLFRLCNPKYHPHLMEELEIHSRKPPSKTGAMTVDNLGILVGVQGVDIARVLKLWNSTPEEKLKYHFPDKEFTRAAFQKWLNRRAWWEQVSLLPLFYGRCLPHLRIFVWFFSILLLMFTYSQFFRIARCLAKGRFVFSCIHELVIIAGV